MIAFPRLLAIDDEPGMLTVLRAAGESAGYEVFATSDPQSFLRYALEWSPTLVLIDLQMPESDGVELLRRLAGHDFCGAITIMSGVDDKLLRSVRDLGRDLGLNIRGTLSKPIRIDVLRRILALTTCVRRLRAKSSCCIISRSFICRRVSWSRLRR